MSNNIYDILNKFNAVEEKGHEPVQQQPKAKTKLAENMETVEGQLNEKYMGFKKTVAAVKKGGSAENPEAVAAAIGRKKYGKEKFQQAAAAGKKLGEEQVNEKWAGDAEVERTGEYAGKTTAELKSMLAKLHKSGPHERGSAAEKKMHQINFALRSKGGWKKGEGAATREEEMAEGQQQGEYSRVLTALRLYYPRLSMEELNVPGYHKVIANKAGVPVEYAADIINGFANPEDYWSDDENNDDEQNVAEVAPPGAKAERMVKHIKKGYAKDGKLTDREKGIAYATAWKAHKAGKVEEAVAALSILSRSGMTAQQISEGWEDMMKAVATKSREEKGTGKFDKKKDPTTGGTIYTRKYNPKSGETDDTENVTAVKRGRGRPKKSAFEEYADKYQSMLEDADPLGKFIQTLPKGSSAKPEPLADPGSPEKPLAPPAGKPQAMGTIKNGVWSADAPKPGEKGVALPVPVDETEEEMNEMMRLAGLKEVSKGEYLKQQDAAAEKAGKDTFNAFGQEFSTDEVDEGTETCNECGYTMTECGCDSGMPEQEEGHMNVSMNVDSDGYQSVTVSADGEDAAKLAQLLKLAGLGSGSAEAVYQPVEVVVGDEEEIEEEKDERYHASTTPDVEVFGTDVQLKGGNGDVAGQEKKMRKHGYQFGDNPLAMKETVARDYESIKVRK